MTEEIMADRIVDVVDCLAGATMAEIMDVLGEEGLGKPGLAGRASCAISADSC